MQNFDQTIISQYANSPTLLQLIENMNVYIDPRANLLEFYNFIWNVDTAQGFGLDIWGKIVGVSRLLRLPSATTPQLWFGFYDGSLHDIGAEDGDDITTESGAALADDYPAAGDYAPFGQAPFYPGPFYLEAFSLADTDFRKLIFAKALANITAVTAPAVNQLLRNLFAGRGRTYSLDLGNMAMRLVFEFVLTPVELAMVVQSGVVPRPAGVKSYVVQVDLPGGVWGFVESGYAQPFGYGTFYLG